MDKQISGDLSGQADDAFNHEVLSIVVLLIVVLLIMTLLIVTLLIQLSWW